MPGDPVALDGFERELLRLAHERDLAVPARVLDRAVTPIRAAASQFAHAVDVGAWDVTVHRHDRRVAPMFARSVKPGEGNGRPRNLVDRPETRNRNDRYGLGTQSGDRKSDQRVDRPADRGEVAETPAVLGVVQLSEPDEYRGGAIVLHIARDRYEAPTSAGAWIAFPSWVEVTCAPVERGRGGSASCAASPSCESRSLGLLHGGDLNRGGRNRPCRHRHRGQVS